MDEAIQLYRVLWRYGYGEIRAYRTGARSKWVTAGNDGSLEEGLSRALWWSDKGWHVGAGINPRSRMRHPCGKGKDVPYYVAFVLDFDTPSMAPVERLRSMGFEPSALVHSGRGHHVYMLLSTPVPVRDAEPVAHAFARTTGSDAVHDPSRILRIPGTVNPRTGTTARVLGFRPDRTYSLEILAECFRPERSPGLAVPPPRPCAVTCASVGGSVVGWTYPSRSEAVMAAARRAWWAGMEREDARAKMIAEGFGERSLKDVDRCLDKVYAEERIQSKVQVEREVITTQGRSLRLRVVDGPFLGRTWWQPTSGIEAHVERCLAQVTAQGRGGAVAVGTTLYNGVLVPRVKFWFPTGG